MGIKISLNDEVIFRIKPRGQAVWDQYFASLHVDPPPPIPDREQLWVLFQIFGPAMLTRMDSPLEPDMEVVP